MFVNINDYDNYADMCSDENVKVTTGGSVGGGGGVHEVRTPFFGGQTKVLKKLSNN